MDADDIAHTVFRTFFRRAASGDDEVPGGEDPRKPMLAMALGEPRSAGSRHRAAGRDVGHSATIDGAAQGPAVRDGAALATLRPVVEGRLEPLSPACRRTVEVRIEGDEVAEITWEVGRPARSVGRVLQGFRKPLGTVHFEDA